MYLPRDYNDIKEQHKKIYQCLTTISEVLRVSIIRAGSLVQFQRQNNLRYILRSKERKFVMVQRYIGNPSILLINVLKELRVKVGVNRRSKPPKVLCPSMRQLITFASDSINSKDRGRFSHNTISSSHQAKELIRVTNIKTTEEGIPLLPLVLTQ